ncbi:MAG: sugar phosphate nucleotidyltransferase, partial [Mariniphaga sp.]|nr:sugar phosphate nucleotidyltransferase [Mariniphaga sp.]
TKIAVPEAFDNAMDMAFSGIHIVDSGIFKRMPDERCFSITDLYLKLAESHLIAGYFDDSDWWSDVGKWDDLVEVRRLMEK